MKATQSTILEFDAVSLFPKGFHHTALQDISLRLVTGESALISVAQLHSCSFFGDLVQGLLDPDTGQVRFLGNAWADLNRSAQAVQRGLTGRVFSRTAWISNLDVDENILLAEQHRQKLSTEELRQTATTLARRFGLTGIPQRRSSQLSWHELKVAQWIRALLGHKQLLILENPLAGVNPSAISVFWEVLAETRQQGTTVLWISHAVTDSEQRQLNPDQLIQIH